MSSAQCRRPCERCCARQVLRTLAYLFLVPVVPGVGQYPRVALTSSPCVLSRPSSITFFVFRVRVRARVCVHYVRVCVPACQRGCEPVYCRRIYIFRPRRLLLGAQPKPSGWRARDGGWKPVHFLEREAGSITVVEPRSLSKKGTVFWYVI